MGYNDPIGGVSRKLTPNIFIHSAYFGRFFFNFGARMSVLKLTPQSYAIYSAVPYAKEVEESLAEAIEDKDWLSKVTHVIIPDTQHTMGILSYQSKLQPNVQIIGMKTLNEEVNKLINVRIDNKVANKVLGADELGKLGIVDPAFTATLKLIYVPDHGNHELAVYDSISNALLTGDLFFNLTSANPLNYKHHNEQFDYKDPATGISFLSGYMNPDSAFCRWAIKKMVKHNADSRNALQEIVDLKFDKLVMCHGDVIESGAYEFFKKEYSSFFAQQLPQ